MDDRYGTDVLARGWRDAGRKKPAPVAASADLVVEVVGDGFVGAVTRVDGMNVELEDRFGKTRLFPLGGGFLVDGAPVVLTAPAAAAKGRTRTASGSFAAEDQRARTARASRIFVEGKHDAELVEKVWGADLRAEGVVVEFLEGVDLLEEKLDAEPPTAERRYGVLVDHLVPNSKESRIAEKIARGRHGAHVRIVGHPSSTCGSASRPVRSASPRGPRCPAASSGRSASAAPSAGPPRSRPTRPARGSTSCRRSPRSATSNRPCSAASRSSSTS